MMALLNRVFIAGFYKEYSGIFILAGLAFVGLCPPGEHWRVFVLFAYTTVTYWPALLTCSVVVLLYAYLLLHFIHSVWNAPSARFLKYSLSSFAGSKQLLGWLLSIVVMILPLLVFLFVAMYMGFWKGDLRFAVLLLLYTCGLLALLLYLITRFTDPLRDRPARLFWNMLGSKMGSDYIALGMRYVLTEQRLAYLLAKVLSYTFVTILFFIYSDVQDHGGVVLLGLTSVGMAHFLVMEGQYHFERDGLRLWRAVPHKTTVRWVQVYCRIALLLLPESVWLLYRYPVGDALTYVLYLSSFVYFLYHLNFLFHPHQSPVRYLFGLFFVLVLLSPMSLLLSLSCCFLFLSALIFWKMG